MNENFEFIPTTRKVDKVYLHCSASNRPNHDRVQVIRDWHKAKGWNDIGYHFFITSKGEIQTGRSIHATPAAQAGHNTDTIAICLHGLNKEDFTPEQYDALILLCDKINKHYNRQITFHGHCEVSDKPCPVYDYREVLNLSPQGNFDCGPNNKSNKPNLRDYYFETFSMGDPIKELQRKLNIWIKNDPNYSFDMLDVDGMFGQDTTRAVVQFQKIHHLTTDGVAGPLTRNALEKVIKYL